MKTVVIGLIGTSLDNRGVHEKRWEKWRPTISLCQHEDLLLNRLELLFQPQYQKLADAVKEDLALVSPETEVKFNHIEFDDPWDFEQVYAALHDFSRGYSFNLEREQGNRA